MYAKTKELEELVVKNGGNGGVSSQIGASSKTVETATRSLVKATVEEVKAVVEAKVQAAYEKAVAAPRQEIAEPYGEWDLVALGPIQPFWYLRPHQIIRVGETAFVATVLYVPKLYHFCLPYEIQYCTGEVCEWRKGPVYLNVTHKGYLSPHTPYAIDVLQFDAYDPGKYEMNICARILCCDPHTQPKYQPPYAGYARRVYDFDPELVFPWFFPNPPYIPAGWQFDTPIRFMVYE
jgi:hypothetical protein